MVDDPGDNRSAPLINGRSAFWQINIGHIGVVCVTLVSAGMLWSGTTNRIGNLESYRAEDKKLADRMAEDGRTKIDSVTAAKIAVDVAAAAARTAVDAAALDHRLDIKRLSDRLDQMDRDGTQASQKGIYHESEFSGATERRVQALEKAFGDLNNQLSSINATIARCDERLQWLTRERTVTQPLHR